MIRRTFCDFRRTQQTLDGAVKNLLTHSPSRHVKRYVSPLTSKNSKNFDKYGHGWAIATNISNWSQCICKAEWRLGCTTAWLVQSDKICMQEPPETCGGPRQHSAVGLLCSLSEYVCRLMQRLSNFTPVSTTTSGQTLDTEHFAVCLDSNVINCQLAASTVVIINS